MRGHDDTPARINRRRFITITAAAAGMGEMWSLAGQRQLQTFSWRGVALGAEATLTLQHHDAAEAQAAIDASLAEVARLEAIFSLYRDNSALVRLNETGTLDDAPPDLVVLLTEALRFSDRTDGAFDPTIQPLWALYARHFSSSNSDPNGPQAREISEVLRHVGWHKIEIADSRIRLLEPGMAISLNGIAQGYTTDKIGNILRARDFEHVLVNMGEQLILGPKWDGKAWGIGIADPTTPGREVTKLSLTSGAVATSGGYGCRFDEAGRFTHILDPCTGSCARRWASVTVVTERATDADGLSTAIAVAPEPVARSLLGGTARAFVIPFESGSGHWL